ncbi:Copper-exporting P-type ATPase A [Bacteroidales bacterium Barb6XT]|nr:Copper-exporting P-type ATPase A [Bacteroidales bacterium Barb6XT]
MKTRKLFLFVISLLLFGLTTNAQEKKNEKQKKDVVTFTVNMTCDNCKKRIEKNVSWEKGVKDLRVDLEKKTVTITYNPQKTTKEKLKTTIEKLEYTCEIAE